MRWNWELPEWPYFKYQIDPILEKDKQFLLGAGSTFAFLSNVDSSNLNQFIIEILTTEGMESSRIEGEYLDRESLQSSIKKHFNLQIKPIKKSPKESGMAELLCNVYATHDQPLSHEILWQWHAALFNEDSNIVDYGKYRTHEEPMQIVSRRYDSPRVFFEAPPSSNVQKEMETFLNWFNAPSKSPLGKAAIAHVYFESIHPFEDGNGRIGRAIVEKALSQSVGKPILIAVSRILEKKKKEYYENLGHCNRTLNVDGFVKFFTDVILEAQKDSIDLLKFLIDKSKLLSRLSGQINERQEKALLRIFAEGMSGFSGGLSAENYIAITKTSKATATRDLNDLVEKGALKKTGILRHTRYWLNLPT
jgi:Fic family protein